MKTSLRHFVVVTILLAVTPLAHALKTDRNQPMDVVADRVDVDDVKGTSTFRGKVHVTRGSMHIKGEVVVIHRDNNNEVKTIVATGKRATYQQRPDNKPTDVIARALTINYDARKEIVTLTRQGEIKQNKDIFRGDKLVYHAKTDKVKATGGSSPSNGRVHMTLQPSKKKK